MEPKNRSNIAGKNTEIEVDIDSLAFGGKGLGRLNGEFVVFVTGALPGDRVRALVTKRKPQYAEAKLLQIITPSPDRQEPKCPLFGLCGGCRTQDLDYAKQCEWKQQQVSDSLRLAANLQQTPFTAHPIIPSPTPWRYRNKMEFSFGTQPDSNGHIDIGLHKTGMWSQTLDCADCFIAPETFTRVTDAMRTTLNDMAATDPRICAYSQKTHQGLLRSLVLRHSVATDTFLIALLTNDAPWFAPKAESIGQQILRQFPNCKGYLWGTTTALSDVAVPEVTQLELGDGIIEETLGARTYRISPFSFFQTNSRGATILYDKVREYAQLDTDQPITLLDAYCGTGTIGIHCADKAARVIGIELIEDAVIDARHNAQRNGFDNCEFHAGDMRQVLGKLRADGQLPAFDRVIVDPPRGGMEAKALKLLLDLNAPLIVYVSCNPTTLARDAQQMIEAGYRIQQIQPVDMFPHTFHVETVCLLSKLHEAKHHVSVKLDMDELDLTASESKATYEEIKKYVAEHYDGMKVTNLYIAQVMRKCGIELAENFNLPKWEGAKGLGDLCSERTGVGTKTAKQPQCPKEKEDAIVEALKHFKMI